MLASTREESDFLLYIYGHPTWWQQVSPNFLVLVLEILLSIVALQSIFRFSLSTFGDNWKPSPAEKWHWKCMIMTWLQICWRVLKSISIMFSLNRCSYIGANYKWNSSSLFFHIRKWHYIGEWQLSDSLHINGQIYWNLSYISTLFLGENTERLSQHLHTKSSWPWFQKPRSNPLNMDKVSPDCLYTYASFFRNNVTPTKQTNESDFLQ